MNKTTYGRFTLKMMWYEVAPHTWIAAMLPVILAFALSKLHGFWQEYSSGDILLLSIALLSISILMQSSVNVFNDYFDYVKGTDTKENCDDAFDAILVYHNIKPSKALVFAIALLASSFVIGLYVIYQAGIIPLIIALIGAAIVALYSAGKTPISYYPIGEIVSGFVMGSLVSYASFITLTHSVSPLIFFFSLPIALGIGLIMLTNNTCDIEKDTHAGRHTLAVYLGRKRARILYHGIVVIIIALVPLSAGLSSLLYISDSSYIFALGMTFFVGAIVFLFAYPGLRALFANELTAQTRKLAMSQIAHINMIVGFVLVIALLMMH